MSLALSSTIAFTAAVVAARSVEVCSYTLADGRVRAALTEAARGGAHVRVRLEGAPLDGPSGGLLAENRAAVAALTAAGADAALTVPGAPLLHMKAALIDGTAWLDDRNWTGDGRDTVVRDSDVMDVAALRAAFEGRAAAGDAALAVTKRAALALERGVIEAAGSAPLAIQTESFGDGAIEGALSARAHAGFPTRLLVAAREAQAPGRSGDRERGALERLAAAGIAVRTSNRDAKLAVADGAAWAGSANATYAGGIAGEQADWGRVVREPALVTGLTDHFEVAWGAAQPWKPTLP